MARRLIAGAAVSIALAMLALHSAKYKELNHYLAEYMSGMHYIEPNTTLLPIAFSRGGDTANGRSLSLRIDFVLNAAGYIATEKRVIDLGNYEASQTNHFPILFRPELNPAVNLYYAPLDIQTRELRAIPTEIAGYQRCPGRHIDYVLLWGVRDRDRDKAIPRLIFKQLHEAYDLIYTSPQHGLMQLYRRKDLNIES